MKTSALHKAVETILLRYRRKKQASPMLGPCLVKALDMLEQDPTLKLMMGPPGRIQDTAHFWVEAADGTVIDKAKDLVPEDYAYLGRQVDPQSVKLELALSGCKTAALTMFPAPIPNRKEHPFVGTLKFQGLTIHVENEPGSVREWPGGQTKMKHYYGEILGSKGTDGDKLDVYVGPATTAKEVYVVHQNYPKSGRYDEDKVMIGFKTPEAAKKAYLAHYDSDKFFGSMTIMSMKDFKKKCFGSLRGEKVASTLNKLKTMLGAIKKENETESEFLRRMKRQLKKMRGGGA